MLPNNDDTTAIAATWILFPITHMDSLVFYSRLLSQNLIESFVK